MSRKMRIESEGKICLRRVVLLLLCILTAACSPTRELTSEDRVATALAKDAATQAARPLNPSTPTSGVPVPTLGPVTHPGGQAGEMFWWNETVFYEVFVRSFKDSNGDGIGDINGLIEKLDYLQDLGVKGLWLMPIMESPSYHGYDVVDYYRVDSEYGTNDDFKHLVKEAHARDMRVLVDLVINHTSSENEWFKASNAGDPAYRDWYIWSEENPGYAGSWGQQVWHPGESGYYYGMFWSGMPDLNLNNPAVTEEINNVIRFWLADMNVDGFRLDAVKHYIEDGRMQENTSATHAWLKNFYQYYKSVEPQAFTVGETWTTTTSAVEYVGDEVDVSFEFDLANAIVRTANSPLTSSVSKQMRVTLDAYPEGQYAVFLTNHDQNRVMSTLDDVDKAKLAAVMLLTSPGVPFIYYGEEIGMKGAKPDEDIRLPMQWTDDAPSAGFSTAEAWRAPAQDFSQVNVAKQADDPESLLNLYRDLIHLRNNHASLQTGHALVIETGNPSVYALLRYNNNEIFLVLVNVNSKPIADYGLSLETGPLAGALKIVTMLGLPNASAPQVNTDGGFSGYIPFAEFPAHSFAVIQLMP